MLQTTIVSQKGAGAHVWCPVFFVATTQGMILDHLTLVDSRAYICSSISAESNNLPTENILPGKVVLQNWRNKVFQTSKS